MALLYQEMKDFDSACDCLKRSLQIIDLYDDKVIEKAITYTNLAQSQLRLDDVKGAEESIDIAMSIFNDGREDDYHYSGALSVYAELMFKKKVSMPVRSGANRPPKPPMPDITPGITVRSTCFFISLTPS